MKNGWIIVVQQDPLQMTIDELLLLLNFTKFFRLLHRSGNDPLVIVLRIGEIKTLKPVGRVIYKRQHWIAEVYLVNRLVFIGFQQIDERTVFFHPG